MKIVDIISESTNEGLGNVLAKAGAWMLGKGSTAQALEKLATRMARRGGKVSADEAERMNMIYKVFEEESFEEEAMSLAENLASMPTRGLGLTKKAVNLGLFNSLEDQLDVEESLQTEAGETDDFMEGVNAFIQKRPAVFKGR